MSFSDMLENQLDEDSNQGVIVDRDKYNDQRVTNALKLNCPQCGVRPDIECRPQNEYQQLINGQWVHIKREML